MTTKSHSLFIFLMVLPITFLLNACAQDEMKDMQVVVVAPIKQSGSTENFPLPNCGGSSELSQSLGSHSGVKKTIIVESKAVGSGGIEVAISEAIRLRLEAQVELAYKQEFAFESSRADDIQLKAAPGTHTVYILRWEEQRYSSMIVYSMKGGIYKTPYTYILSVPKVSDSYKGECPSSTGGSCNKAILLNEDFNSPKAVEKFRRDRVSIVNGRLHFVANPAQSGTFGPSFGQYEAFNLDFVVYPVGEMFDASVNILFLKHSTGWYEVQIRLRRHQIQFFKFTQPLGQNNPTVAKGIGWTYVPSIDFGIDSSRIRLYANAGNFKVWVNDQVVFTYVDMDYPYLLGEIQFGAGAGNVAPVELEIDDLTICAV